MSSRLRGSIRDDAPFVTITVGTHNQRLPLAAVVDTGCDCDLVMSRRKAKELGLQEVGTTHAWGAFNNREPTTVFEGHVSGWFGLARSVTVHAPENCPQPLIGMGLLADKTISFQDDGQGNDVHIVKASDCRKASAVCRECPIK
jgi:predicted aspartyl protease